MENISQIIGECSQIIESLKSSIPIEQHGMRLSQIDFELADADFWSKNFNDNNQKKYINLLKERQELSDLVIKFTRLYSDVCFYKEIYPELGLNDREQHALSKLYDELIDFEFKQMMKDPLDDSPAILTINAGAGGLEAANWVTMLSRMYVRWADNNKFIIDILDDKPSEEHSSICTDSISYRISGQYAYGFLKGETGVHRLIRNSPFNSGDARHTSFAAVSVMPDIEDTIDIKIEDKDIVVTAQTSSGSGGQNVNKVASAIRLRHIPTGINILVRTERDQLANKKTAFKMLKAKLYEIEVKKKQSEQDKILNSQLENKFGSQIRTYTESPYSLVKDHRTNFEINNFEQVLDGNVDGFMYAFLKKSF